MKQRTGLLGRYQNTRQVHTACVAGMGRPGHILLLFLLLLAGCRTPQLIETGDLSPADITPEELTALIPVPDDSLETLSGEGRAIISRPGANESVVLDFHSDHSSSLMSVRDRFGIERARILVDADSVLVYNLTENVAEKTSIDGENLSRIGSLATVNLIDLMVFRISESDITDIFEDENYYVTDATDGLRVTIRKSDGLIVKAEVSGRPGYPYREINYESYEQLNGFYLPRRMTIFSADGESRVIFLVRNLQVNRPLPPMRISIPEDTPVHNL